MTELIFCMLIACVFAFLLGYIKKGLISFSTFITVIKMPCIQDWTSEPMQCDEVMYPVPKPKATNA